MPKASPPLPVYDRPCEMLREVRVLLAQLDILKLHKETGLPFYWLRKLRTGEIRTPSVNRVAYLHKHLMKTPIGQL